MLNLYVIKESLGQPVKLLLELAWTFKQTKTQNVPSTPDHLAYGDSHKKALEKCH